MCKTAKNRRISDDHTSFRFNSENEASALVDGLINADENLGFSGGRILVVDDNPGFEPMQWMHQMYLAARENESVVVVVVETHSLEILVS